jgi:hypothetical protein
MQIHAINISKRYQGSGYDCRVTIDSSFSNITLVLDEEYTQRVLDVVADLIVDGSKRVAESLTKQALDHKAIEHKAAEG